MSKHSLDQFDQAWDIVEAVRGLSSEVRAKAIHQACGDDERLLRTVEALLSTQTSAVLVTGGAQAIAGEAVADSARELLDDIGPGDQVGTYRLLEELGSGGMSRVYLGRREGVEFEQQVAVKLMRAFSSAGSESRFRFEREQQVLANLSHPHIASIVDGGVTPSGRPFLVMEYVNGLPVTEFCQAQSLSLEERLSLFLDICAAVEHAHRALVVHRDLKPSNVLVNTDGQVKLLDFGIAKLLDEAGTSDLTQTGLMMLTPQYAAPEQVTNASITTATDVYALGLLLYELLVDQKAWDAQKLSVSEQLASICELQPVMPSKRTPAVPWSSKLKGDLDLIVAKAISKVPAERYPSSSELARDVRAWLNGRPVSAHAPGLGYRLAKFGRRNWLGVATAATFAGVVGLFMVALIQQQAATELERDRARQAQEATSAVNRFLIDELLGATSTKEGIGRDVPVSVLLQRAEETVARAFTDQPALEVSVRETLSRTFLRLGDIDRAETNLRAARDRLNLPLPGRVLSDNGERAIASRFEGLDLIEIELKLAKGDELAAREAAESMFSELSQAPGTPHINTVLSQLVLARAQIRLDEWPEAQAHLIQALEVLQREYPDRWRLRSEAQFDLARVLYEQRQTVRALEILNERFDLQTRYLGENHPDILKTLRWQSLVLSRLQRREEAAEVAASVYALTRRIFGEDHLETGIAAGGLARLYVRTRRYDEAVELFGVELAAHRREHGEAHVDTLNVMQNLGVALSYAGEAEQAERIKQKALDGYTALYGERHSRTLRAHRNLASTLAKTGQVTRYRNTVSELSRIYASFEQDTDADPIQLSDAAEWLLTCEPADFRDPSTALRIAQSAVDASERQVGEALLTLGDALAANDQLDQAISTYEEAATHQSMAHIHALVRNAAKLYVETGQIARGEHFFRNHQERRLSLRAADDWLHGMTLHEYARFYVHAGLGAQAVPVVQRAITQYEKTRGAEDPLILRARAVLGAALSQMGNIEQAEYHLSEAYEGLIGDRQVTSTVKREIIRWFIEHYSVNEQSAQVERWRSELQRRLNEPLFADWRRSRP